MAPLPLYLPQQVRAMDERAVRATGLSAYELMGRAGASAWALLQARWPQARGIGVMCGPGNNGGDGYVVARLAKAAGLQVRVLVVEAGGPRTAEAARACCDWREMGGEDEIYRDALPEVDVWVDALYGTGISRSPEGAAREMIDAVNASGVAVLALDIPSGLDVACGSAPGAAVHAAVTLSFVAAKRGLYTGPACDFAGEVLLDRLGLAPDLFADVVPVARLYRREQLAAALAPRRRNAHKGDCGHVLCVGGDSGMGGAARLCAEAALRAGAGLVSVAARSGSVAALAAARPEAMANEVEDAQSLRRLIERADVLAVGPGLGTATWGQAMCRVCLESGKPLVLDADGLNLLAADPRPLPQAILTPHPGEAARLLGVSIAEIQADRFAAARSLVERYRCVVVLKGAGSLVAAPGEIDAIIGAGNPGMASGGMGDALTGVVAALLAQGLSLFDAAAFGALLHGAAGDEAASDGGERGLLASDLFPHVRRLANPR